MKDALCATSNIEKSNIHVIRPDVSFPLVSNQNFFYKETSSEQILLYPATPYFYKNHMLIIEALKILKAKGRLTNLKFQVTFSEKNYPKFVKEVKVSGLSAYIDYLGFIPYEDLISKYQAADIILFPSYVETYGLPLAEGASFGKPVLCSDLAFSRDILSDYQGAFFLDYKDPHVWAKAIDLTLKKVEENSMECGEFKFKPSLTWKDFFNLINCNPSEK